MIRSAKSRLVLACASDGGYGPYAATMLLSAIQNTPDTQIDLHYLHDPDFPKTLRIEIGAALDGYESRVHLQFHEISDDSVKGLPILKLMSMNGSTARPTMWYRILLPHILQSEPRVLYLDCDTLVLDDLNIIWDTPLENMALAAVSNPFHVNSPDKDWALQLGLPGRGAYFNSGVMLMNLDYFRAHDSATHIMENGRTNAAWLRSSDQDSLNILLYEKRQPLAPRWNLMRTIMTSPISREVFKEEELSLAIRSPGIVHFEGGTKPWIDPSGHPYGRYFALYARQLPWPIAHKGFTLNDVDNFLIRNNWRRMHNRFQRLRNKLKI